MENVIGRTEEKALIRLIENSGEPELLAMYGRRRIGKTFLIRNGFSQGLCFEFSGTHNATLNQELENFSVALSNASGGLPLAIPKSWIHGFQMLVQYLMPLIKKKKKELFFFDEFPWINSPRSGFMAAFENFWNSWASKEKNLVVVICGSAASWMIKKVINNRGGLHKPGNTQNKVITIYSCGNRGLFKSKKSKAG